MVEILTKPVQLALVLHTNVDYLYLQGAGKGVVQRAECITTGSIKYQLSPGQERKYGITRENLTTENIKTARRAQLLGLLHALGLARRTIERGCPKAAQVQKVNVFSDSVEAVQTTNHHLKHAPESLQNVVSTNDYSIIKRILTKVRETSRLGVEVAITVSTGKDKAEGKARKMARQKGRKACRSRRRQQLAHAISVEGQKEPAGDEETCQLVIRIKDALADRERDQVTLHNE